MPRPPAVTGQRAPVEALRADHRGTGANPATSDGQHGCSRFCCARCGTVLLSTDKQYFCASCFASLYLHGRTTHSRSRDDDEYSDAHWSHNSSAAILRWARGMPRRALGTSTGLSHYIFSTMPDDPVNELPAIFIPVHNAPRGDPPHAPSDDVWPMAPPFRWTTGRPPKSARRRRRWLTSRSVELMVNLQVCLMSHLHLRRV